MTVFFALYFPHWAPRRESQGKGPIHLLGVSPKPSAYGQLGRRLDPWAQTPPHSWARLHGVAAGVAFC
jgi:hypothetical protein